MRKLKKLVVNKQTIKQLSGSSLEAVAGGQPRTLPRSVYPPCITDPEICAPTAAC